MQDSIKGTQGGLRVDVLQFHDLIKIFTETVINT